MTDIGVTNTHEPRMTPSEKNGRAPQDPLPPQDDDTDQSTPNPWERGVRRFDRWQQSHGVISFPIAVVKKFGDDEAGNLVSLLAYNSFVAAFPLLLAFTAILGVLLREHPGLHAKLVNSALAEFPIIGGQIHDQLGVEAFSSTFPSLMIGVAGALVGGRGFANTLQHTLNTVWAVPKVDRPGFFPRYLRTLGTAVASRPHRRRHRGCQHRRRDSDLPRVWRPTGTDGQPGSRDDIGLRILRRAFPGGCGWAGADALACSSALRPAHWVGRFC